MLLSVTEDYAMKPDRLPPTPPPRGLRAMHQAGESYEWRRTPPWDSLRAACCVLLLPLIVAGLTAGFLGYALWRLAYLFWQLLRLTWRAIRTRQVGRTSPR